ncbi:MAG: hypothetical protein GX347_02505 [Epulopiscium sp.]|nr:hypothetical protein [Candidatus Epulonipiscium sp.]
MRKHFASIEMKIRVLSIICIIIPLTIVGILSSSITFRILKKQTNEAHIQKSLQSINNIDFILQDIQKSVDTLVMNQEIIDILLTTDFSYLMDENYYEYVKSKNVIQDIFTNYLIGHPEIAYINFSTKETAITAKEDVDFCLNQLNLYQLEQGKWYKHIKNFKDSFIWEDGSTLLHKNSYKDLIFYVSMVYHNETSQELGMVAIGIKKRALLKKIKQSLVSDKDIIAIIHKKKIILDPFNIANQLNMMMLNKEMDKDNTMPFSFECKIDSDPYLGAYGSSFYSGWDIIHISSLYEVINRTNEIKQITIKLTFICILSALLLERALNNQIIMPIKNLTALSTSIDYDFFNKKDFKAVRIICPFCRTEF